MNLIVADSDIMANPKAIIAHECLESQKKSNDNTPTIAIIAPVIKPTANMLFIFNLSNLKTID